MTVFLCGDVMTGRGIDQILPHGGDPTVRELVVTDARTYVTLAERVSGPISTPAGFTWPWGDALTVLDEFTPDVRLLNLETSITGGGEFAPGKTLHYRMHPDNVGCLSAARPDVCSLANNHVLDFGPKGLTDTLSALTRAGIRSVGAGLDVQQAERPVLVDIPGSGRVLTVAVGIACSGVPRSWAATADRPGVAFILDLSEASAARITDRVLALKRPGDVAVASLHLGSNWGYQVESGQVDFAHRLIDAGIDVVYGHSSHHPRPIEVYRGKLILYGCGDIINDYEGITSYEAFRAGLRLLYFASVDPSNGNLVALRMVGMRVRRMRLERAAQADAEWLRAKLGDISRDFNTRVDGAADGTITVRA